MNKKSTDWLKKEIDTWEKEGLITAHSARVLKERYRAKATAIEETSKRRMLVITFISLGITFISLGTVLFFVDRWQFIPNFLKTALIIISMCLAYMTGFYFKFHKEHPRIGGAFILLGAVLFGFGLFINNQIFNLGFSLQQNILFWFIFILPVGYFTYSKKVLDLGLILLSIWLGFEAKNWIDLKTKSELYIYLYYFFGIFIYSIGIIHNQIKKVNTFKGPYQIIGGFLLLCAIYLLTFLDTIPTGFFLKLDILGDLKSIIIIAGCALLFLLIAVAFRKKRQYILAVQIYSLIPALVLGLLSIFGIFRGLDALIFNILFLALIIGLIIVGVNTKEVSLINLGIAFFIIDIISRFFDIFWELLPRAMFFILGGLILALGGAYLEITRRRLLKRIRW
jgi:uncharacterized membrane protein